jgi:hypothetical protein
MILVAANTDVPAFIAFLTGFFETRGCSSLTLFLQGPDPDRVAAWLTPSPDCANDIASISGEVQGKPPVSRFCSRTCVADGAARASLPNWS